MAKTSCSDPECVSRSTKLVVSTWQQCRSCFNTFCEACMSTTEIRIVEYCWRTPQTVCRRCYTTLAKQESLILEIRALRADQSQLFLSPTFTSALLVIFGEMWFDIFFFEYYFKKEQGQDGRGDCIRCPQRNFGAQSQRHWSRPAAPIPPCPRQAGSSQWCPSRNNPCPVDRDLSSQSVLVHLQQSKLCGSDVCCDACVRPCRGRTVGGSHRLQQG